MRTARSVIESAAASSGRTPPDENVVADVNAAWTGRAEVSSEMPEFVAGGRRQSVLRRELIGHLQREGMTSKLGSRAASRVRRNIECGQCAASEAARPFPPFCLALWA